MGGLLVSTGAAAGIWAGTGSAPRLISRRALSPSTRTVIPTYCVRTVLHTAGAATLGRLRFRRDRYAHAAAYCTRLLRETTNVMLLLTNCNWCCSAASYLSKTANVQRRSNDESC